MTPLLTKRQEQVAALAAEDRSFREIADALTPPCDLRTVEAHVATIAQRIKDSGFPSPRGGLWLIRRWMREQRRLSA